MNKSHENVYNFIIDKIENGNFINWTSFIKSPINYMTKDSYKGINRLTLSFGKTPYFLTLKQINLLGGNIKKGAKGFPIIYYTFNIIENKDKTLKKISMIKNFYVFNSEDIQGIEFENIETINTCEDLFLKLNDVSSIVNYNNTTAYYDVVNDIINMPKINYFVSSAEYYSTLFHEIIHSTGHPKRLERFSINDKPSQENYSKEELIAELGTAFLCADCGISESVINNQTAYLKGWLSVLQNDKNILFSACREAEKAIKYLYKNDLKQVA